MSDIFGQDRNDTFRIYLATRQAYGTVESGAKLGLPG